MSTNPNRNPDRIVRKRLSTLRPSPENETIYGRVNPNDPEVISGHRRYTAACRNGQKIVPCRVLPISRRETSPDEYLKTIRDYNLQRDKSLDVKLREELADTNPNEAYQSLIDHRRDSSVFGANTRPIEGVKRRSKISQAKSAMMASIREIIFVERVQYWPMSVRAVHYAILNHQPLRNVGRPKSHYENDRKSYQDLSNLLTRSRLNGEIPWEAISDETRPSIVWNAWAGPRPFIRDQFDKFLKGYWRDLLRRQPNHIEVIAEKNSVWPIVKGVTGKYCIPTMSGRGFSSIDPYRDIEKRYLASGKQKLIVIVASDFDPEGEEIVQVAGRTLRDDFKIQGVELVKCAVTPEQIETLELPPNLVAKESSSRYKKFVARHGKNVYELEALTPQQLEQSLTAAIDSVIDIDLFNAELDAEKRDASFLEGVRKTVHEALKDMDIDGAHSDF